MSQLSVHCLDENDTTKPEVVEINNDAAQAEAASMNYIASVEENTPVEDNNNSFESLLLSENVIKGLKKVGFEKPSPVQLKAIPIGLCGFDLNVHSEYGKGKTLVFTIIGLENVEITNKSTQVLIIAPTKESAIYIQEVIQLVGSQIKGLKIEALIEEKEKYKACHIAIGLPERISRLITEGVLKTDCVRLFVLDEADKLMEPELRNYIDTIYNALPLNKQIITTGATFPSELGTFLDTYTLSPTRVSLDPGTATPLGPKQFAVVLESPRNIVQQLRMKNEELVKIFSNITFTKCLVFSNYQTRAESVCKILNEKGRDATLLSGAQSKKQKISKTGNSAIVLCTDVMARDRNVSDDATSVDLLINYDIPIDIRTYLLRIFRAFRYDTAGICINLVSEGIELNQLQNVLGSVGLSSIPKLSEFKGAISDLFDDGITFDSTVSAITNDNSSDEPGILNEKPKIQSNQELKEILIMQREFNNGEINGRAQLNNSEINGRAQLNNAEINGRVQLNNAPIELHRNIQAAETLNDDSGCDSSDHDSDGEKKGPDLVTKQEDLVKTIDNLNRITNNFREIRMKMNKLNTRSALRSSARENADTKSEDTGDGNPARNAAALQEPESVEAASDNLIYENETEKKLHDTFVKNVALLRVSKILDLSHDADKSEERSIEKYLELLKKQEGEIQQFNGESIPNILTVLENVDELAGKEEQDISPMTNGNDRIGVGGTEDVPDLEHIFKFGFKCLVQSNSDNWREALAKMPAVVYCNSKEIDDDEEMGSLDSGEGCVANSDTSATDNHGDDFMKWTPVVEKTKKTVSTPEIVTLYTAGEDETDLNVEAAVGTNKQNHYEQFNEYFDNCSDYLWQNALSFGDVASFDEWFQCGWEAQVNAVRHYVQQNVYIQEMAHYQDASRTRNKPSE